VEDLKVQPASGTVNNNNAAAAAPSVTKMEVKEVKAAPAPAEVKLAVVLIQFLYQYL
jgi:hypothetical protein